MNHDAIWSSVQRSLPIHADIRFSGVTHGCERLRTCSRDPHIHLFMLVFIFRCLDVRRMQTREHFNTFSTRTGSNPMPADRLSAAERRAELCCLLAAGLIRLRMWEQGQHIEGTGEVPLHNSLDQSGSAGPTNRRTR